VLKVSVIVPVYNPGRHIDGCIASLLGQTLPRDQYELIFVDDGSTDGTGARLDELAAMHAGVRVEHIPNSGWPGKPRNVGLDMARGEFVYFVDNDDRLARDALERLHRAALQEDADIVIGKVVGVRRGVPRELFERNRSGVDLDWAPLLSLLTPHKLFRRQFVERHGIRFPDEPRRLEDHYFVMHAYFHEPRITVLADAPVYYWVHRGEEVNASAVFEAARYFEDMRGVLDIVEEHTEPGPARDRLLMHWYRGKMLGRVGGPGYPRRDYNFRGELLTEVRKVANERYGPWVDEYLPLNLRVRSHVMLSGDRDDVERLAAFEQEVRARVWLHELRPHLGDLRLRFTAALRTSAGGLHFEPRRDRIYWAPPEALELRVPVEVLDVTDEIAKASAQVFLRSLDDDGVEYLVPGHVRARLAPFAATADYVRAVVDGDMRLTAVTGAAGAQLPPGEWEVRARVTVAGFTATARLRRQADGDPLVVVSDHRGRLYERREAEAIAPEPAPQSRTRRFRRVAASARARIASVAAARR
jgi:poly(ribitol-phosphate) beta-N-acetylglucosaminyltransferase